MHPFKIKEDRMSFLICYVNMTRIVHKFWKYRVAEQYKEYGYKVLVEEFINGRPDIIVEKDNIKTAIEIETGKSDFMKNIERNLKAGFDEIIVMATSKNVKGRILRDLVKMKKEFKRVKLVNEL